MKCKNYKKENKYETNWKEIIQDSSKNKEKLIIAREAIERRNMRKKLLQVGLPQVAPKAPQFNVEHLRDEIQIDIESDADQAII